MSWPTTDDPRTEFVTIRLTKTEAADVDWLISHVNAKNRSAAVRGAVERVITAEKKRAKKAGHAGGAVDPDVLAEKVAE